MRQKRLKRIAKRKGVSIEEARAIAEKRRSTTISVAKGLATAIGYLPFGKAIGAAVNVATEMAEHRPEFVEELAKQGKEFYDRPEPKWKLVLLDAIELLTLLTKIINLLIPLIERISRIIKREQTSQPQRSDKANDRGKDEVSDTPHRSRGRRRKRRRSR